MAMLALAGDVMLGRGVSETFDASHPEKPWGNVLPLLLEADVRMANLECALTQHNQPWSRTAKVFHFRADLKAGQVLKAAHIDAVSLANNHVLDFEERGLLDTLHHLSKAGIAFAGAGKDIEAAERPAIVDAGTLRFGLVAFTDNEPAFAAGHDRPGTQYLAVSTDETALGSVDRAISAARKAGADIVVFSNHWGPNMVERPSKLFRLFAHTVVDLGADIYFGHSAHIFQGVEIYHGKPILYDTGDFIDDYVVDPLLRNDWSFLFCLNVEKDGVQRLDLFPLKLSFAQIQRAVDPERKKIMHRMELLSSELGTHFERHDDRLVCTINKVWKEAS
jgi:poly-gamma-glutamate capsule biosynthesis protein CapA/YwtB (metallophosphatase superfamily)